MNTVTIIALILIFAGGIGAILLSVGQAQSSQADKSDIINTTKDENTSLRKQLTDLQNERNELKKDLKDRDQKLNNQTKEIINLNNKIVEKSEYIEKFISSGTSFPYIDLKKSVGSNQNDQYYFTLVNDFEYPIYNILVQIFDYDVLNSKAYFDKRDKIHYIKLEDYKTARKYTTNLDELPSNSSRMSEDLLTPKPANLLIKINCRNTVVLQKIAMIKKGIDFYAGYQVFDTRGVLLKEEIYGDPSFIIRKELKEALNAIEHIEYTFSN
ncbi:MAG TPA: hypothetical protein PL009_13535 [Flavipsychrobacter sp.]|nr:hypothetical protein [Flavipsychrobacter sp.]